MEVEVGNVPTENNSSPNTPATVEQNPANESFVPDEYKNEPWAKKFTDKKDFFKSFSEAQKLLGKQGKVLPDDGASEEQLNAFFDGIKPKDVSGYALKETGDAKIDGLNGEIKNAMLASGLHPFQANKLLSLVAPIFSREAEAQKEAYDEQKLSASVVNSFGNRADEITAKSTEFFSSLSGEDKQAVAKLPNNALLAIMKAVDKNGVRESGHINTEPSSKGTGLDAMRERDKLYEEYRGVSAFDTERRNALKQKIYELNKKLFPGE